MKHFLYRVIFPDSSINFAEKWKNETIRWKSHCSIDTSYFRDLYNLVINGGKTSYSFLILMVQVCQRLEAYVDLFTSKLFYVAR